MSEQPVRTPSALTRTQLRWAWGATAVVVLLFGFGVTDWQVIAERLLEGDTAEVVAFTAGYTLPLTVGIGTSVGLALYNRRAGKPIGDIQLVIGVALILIICGLLASWLGLGLAPEFTWRWSGPPYVALPLMALTGYFNTYGWPLMLCAAAIGTTAALHLDYWRSEPDAVLEDLTD